MKKIVFVTLAAASIVGAVFLMKPAAHKVNAQAGTGVNSRPEWTGYYTNVPGPDINTVMPSQTRYEPYGFPGPTWDKHGGLESAFTSPDNFTNLVQFVGLMRRILFVTQPGDDWFACVGHIPVAYGQNAIYEDPCVQRKMAAQWASFIINTQLGKNGSDFAGCNHIFGQPDPWDNWFCGLDYARNHFSEWETTINYYAGQGWIEWNAPVGFPSGHLNTLNGWYGEDSTRFTQMEAEFAFSIVFHNPPTPSNPLGSQYIIKKWCGNVTGEATPLVPPPTGDIVTANCNVVEGWAYDPKNFASGYITQIKVYRDALGAFGGLLVGTQSANQPGPAGQSPYPGTITKPDGTTVPVQGNHGYSVDISPYQDINPHNYYVVAVAGNGQEFPLMNSPKSVPSCKTPSCSALTLADQASGQDLAGKPEPGAPFSAEFGVTISPAPPGATGNYSIALQQPLPPPPAASGPVVYNQKSGQSTTVSNITINTPGVYNFHWTYNWAGGSRACDATIQVATRPYFKVYGNDISAGGNFDTAGDNCAATPALFPDATILAYGRNSGGHMGAGVQFAAQTLGVITDFFSADGGAAPPSPPAGLTFANYDGSVAMPGFGGNSSMPVCAPDYYSNATRPGVTPTGGSVGLLDGARSYTGPVTVGGTIAKGAKVVLYVDGDVIITSDIMFAAGPYANRNEIPSLFIIARGNIYVASTVNRIDGFFIAQPKSDGSAGNIYTCAINSGGTWRTPNSAEIYNQCGGSDKRRLVINGSFIAKKIHLLRSNGTVHGGSNDEPSSSDNIAEIFNFTPELYMAEPHSSLSVPGSKSSYNSINSLPPIL
jgi:hypothetical protein